MARPGPDVPAATAVLAMTSALVVANPLMVWAGRTVTSARTVTMVVASPDRGGPSHQQADPRQHRK